MSSGVLLQQKSGSGTLPPQQPPKPSPYTPAQIAAQNAEFAAALKAGKITQAQYNQAMVTQNANLAQDPGLFPITEQTPIIRQIPVTGLFPITEQTPIISQTPLSTLAQDQAAANYNPIKPTPQPSPPKQPITPSPTKSTISTVSNDIGSAVKNVTSAVSVAETIVPKTVQVVSQTISKDMVPIVNLVEAAPKIAVATTPTVVKTVSPVISKMAQTTAKDVSTINIVVPKTVQAITPTIVNTIGKDVSTSEAIMGAAPVVAKTVTPKIQSDIVTIPKNVGKIITSSNAIVETTPKIVSAITPSASKAIISFINNSPHLLVKDTQTVVKDTENFLNSFSQAGGGGSVVSLSGKGSTFVQHTPQAIVERYNSPAMQKTVLPTLEAAGVVGAAIVAPEIVIPAVLIAEEVNIGVNSALAGKIVLPKTPQQVITIAAESTVFALVGSALVQDLGSVAETTNSATLRNILTDIVGTKVGRIAMFTSLGAGVGYVTGGEKGAAIGAATGFGFSATSELITSSGLPQKISQAFGGSGSDSDYIVKNQVNLPNVEAKEIGETPKLTAFQTMENYLNYMDIANSIHPEKGDYLVGYATEEQPEPLFKPQPNLKVLNLSDEELNSLKAETPDTSNPAQSTKDLIEQIKESQDENDAELKAIQRAMANTPSTTGIQNNPFIETEKTAGQQLVLENPQKLTQDVNYQKLYDTLGVFEDDTSFSKAYQQPISPTVNYGLINPFLKYSGKTLYQQNQTQVVEDEGATIINESPLPNLIVSPTQIRQPTTLPYISPISISIPTIEQTPVTGLFPITEQTPIISQTPLSTQTTRTIQIQNQRQITIQQLTNGFPELNENQLLPYYTFPNPTDDFWKHHPRSRSRYTTKLFSLPRSYPILTGKQFLKSQNILGLKKPKRNKKLGDL